MRMRMTTNTSTMSQRTWIFYMTISIPLNNNNNTSHSYCIPIRHPFRYIGPISFKHYKGSVKDNNTVNFQKCQIKPRKNVVTNRSIRPENNGLYNKEGQNITWTIPVWSLRLMKVRPPWIRWRATHPQSLTRLPTSFSVNSPQYWFLLTHWSASVVLGGGDRGILLSVTTTEVEEEEEEERGRRGGLMISEVGRLLMWKLKK